MPKNLRRNLGVLILVLSLLLFFTKRHAFAGPKSSTYELKSYGFGAGGSDNASSPNYKSNTSVGEVEGAQTKSSNYKVGAGLSYTQLANTPAAPTLGNGTNTYYNKLDITLDTGGNPTTAEFLINISTDGFVSDTTHFIQADHTIGTSSIWQTNTSWGVSGFTIIGLTPGVTYSLRVAARAGNFTQSPYSATATKATVNPTLSFSFSPNTINNWTLTPSAVSTSSIVSVNLSTNAASGGTIYMYGTNGGLRSTTNSHTISSVSNDLTALNEGYGAQGASVTQASGGPMELVSPYNLTGNTVGIVNTSTRVLADTSSLPVTTGQATFTLKAKTATNTPAGSDYADILTLIVSGAF